MSEHSASLATKPKRYFTLPSWSILRQNKLIFGLVLPSLFINILALALPITLLQIYDRVLAQQSLDTLILLMIGLGIAISMESFLRIARLLISQNDDMQHEYALRKGLFKDLLQSTQHSLSLGIGATWARFMAYCMSNDDHGKQMLSSLVDLPFVVLFLVVMGYIGGLIVVVPLVILVLFAVAGGYCIYHLLPAIKQHCLTEEWRWDLLIEYLHNMHAIKALGLEREMMRRFETMQQYRSRSEWTLVIRYQRLLALGVHLAQLAIVAVATVGAILVINQHISLGAIAACTLLTGRVIQPCVRLMLWQQGQAVHRIYDELNQNHWMSQPKGLLDKNTHVLWRDLHLQSLCYAHPTDPKRSLQDVTVTISQYTMTAITDYATCPYALISILAGIQRPERGQMYLDEQDICDVDMSAYRKHVICLTGDESLLTGTLLDNLTGFQDQVNFAQLEEYVQALGLRKTISALADGYKTPLIHAAVSLLSRDIIQRVTLIRALMQNPALIILNEPAFLLDEATLLTFLNYLRQPQQQCTTIVFTNKLSMLAAVDHQYQLKQDA